MLELNIQFLSNFDVISFDIFDTLLLRPYLHPEDVWKVLGNEFYQARVKADRETYARATKRGGEHTLEEAYSLMGPKWQGWKARELEAQRKCLVANPEMLELWNKLGELGKKRVIVSDMYVDETWLQETLCEKGIIGWDAFYVSSARQKRKRTGALYELMKKEVLALCQFDSDNVKFLHIGDNVVSDVKMAEQSGITALRYVTITDRFFDEFPFAREFLQIDSSFEQERIVGALVLGWHLYKCSHPQLSFWNRIGFLLGGMLGYSYVKWILLKCREHQFEHLMFVGRDGYIWQKIARAICPEIKSDYFYAPRTISVRVLGVEAIQGHADVGKDRKRFADEFQTSGDSSRANTVFGNYLRQFNIDPRRAALVDGMSSQFSAQRLVEKVIGHDVHTFYLMAYSAPRKGEAYIRSEGCSINFQGLSEFLFGSPEAPVVDMTDDGPVFKKEVDPFEKLKMSVCDEMASAAVYCAEALSKANVMVSPQDWVGFCDMFAAGLTLEDLLYLEFARISTDVNHLKYRRIMEMRQGKYRWWTRGQRFNVLGHPIFRAREYVRDGIVHESLWLFGRIPIMFKRRRLYSFPSFRRIEDDQIKVD